MPISSDNSNQSSDTVQSEAELRTRIAELEAALAAERAKRIADAQIVASLHDAMIILSPDYTIQEWNQAAERLYGWRTDEVRGQRMSSILPARYLDPVTPEQVFATMAQHGAWTGRVAHRHRDGHEIIIDSAVRYLRDTAGSIIGLVGINRDITERVRAEQARNTTLAQLDTLLTSADVGVGFLDHTLRYTQVNHTLAAMNGLPVSEHIGRSIRDILPGLADDIERLLTHVLTSGKAVTNLEFHDTSRQGEASKTYLVNYYPVTDQEQSIIGVGSVIFDITERKQMQLALQQNEARYRMLFDHAPIALWEEDFSALRAELTRLQASGITDLRGHLTNQEIQRLLKLVRITDVNAASLELYQAPTKQALLQGLPESSDLSLLEPDRESLLAIAEGRTRFECEMSNFTLTGQRIDIVLSWAVMPGYETSWTRVLLSVVDLTERNRLSTQLIQSQKMESIGRLAGGIAHDFNNLLTAISGYTDFARESLPPSHPIQAELTEITRATGRATALTRQLLAFARKQMLTPQILNPNQLIQETEKLLRRVIGEDIELITMLTPARISIRADPAQIQQILINLAVNARDAMPRGGQLTISTDLILVNTVSDMAGPKVVAVQAGAALLPGRYVRIIIGDTGSGMAPAVQARLFEPFFTTKEPGQGTGLGLATCYGIVKQHSGSIWVDSVLNKGTAVTVALPIVEAELDTPKREQSDELPRGTETMLLVEDEAAVRTFTARTLRRLGYTVIEASDGLEAIRLLQTGISIQLLLTDVVMPHISGLALAAQLVAKLPDLKVIYMSGYAPETLFDGQAGDTPLETYGPLIQKPFSRTELAQRIRLVLDQNSTTPD